MKKQMCSSLAASHLPWWHQVRDGGPLMQQELRKQYSSCLCQGLSWWPLWQLCPLPSDSSKQLRCQTGIDFFPLDYFDRMIGATSRLESKDTYSFSPLSLFFSFTSCRCNFYIYPQRKKSTGYPMRQVGVLVRAPLFSNCAALGK